MGIAAVGVPGASNFYAEEAEVLRGLKLLIHHESDRGGDTFVRKITSELRSVAFKGDVYVWSCSANGVKDPSDLLVKYGPDDAKQMIHDALAAAKPLDYLHEEIPERIAGEPIPSAGACRLAVFCEGHQLF